MAGVINSVSSLRLMERALSLHTGGGDGILLNEVDTGEVVANVSPNMYVYVQPFSGFIGGKLVRNEYIAAVGPVVAPTGGSEGELRRVDIVQYTLGVGLNIKTGSDAGSPTPPSTDSNSILLAYIYCRNGMTVITDADDSSNGYIADAREIV